MRHFRRGAYSKPTKGDCKPGRRIFPKKTDEGFFRAFRGLPPPFSRARPRAPTTHYPLHSSPYSLLNGSPLRADHALPSPFFSRPSTGHHRRLKNQYSKKSIMFSEKRIYVAMQTGLYV